MEIIFETEKGIAGRVWSYANDLFSTTFDQRLDEFSGALEPAQEARLISLVVDIQRHSLEVGYKLARLED